METDFKGDAFLFEKEKINAILLLYMPLKLRHREKLMLFWQRGDLRFGLKNHLKEGIASGKAPSQ